ncbi:hypothetical protein [Pseudaquabacterium pictum]|uniref:hypothetical protein n=1 Tax=Pseudaquabacterium pictum TaxID=2315236 RepID=UPI0010F44768|nr:hypothetical protein [Rubrivivax pictus]
MFATPEPAGADAPVGTGCPLADQATVHAVDVTGVWRAPAGLHAQPVGVGPAGPRGGVDLHERHGQGPRPIRMLVGQGDHRVEVKAIGGTGGASLLPSQGNGAPHRACRLPEAAMFTLSTTRCAQPPPPMRVARGPHLLDVSATWGPGASQQGMLLARQAALTGLDWRHTVMAPGATGSGLIDAGGVALPWTSGHRLPLGRERLVQLMAHAGRT